MKKTNKKANKKNTINKIKLYAAGLALGTGLGLAGCEEVESKPITSEVVSELESEKASEVVSEVVEVPTEEVTEEVSEEVVDVYSAEAMITMMDELTDKYQYNDPDQMRSVIFLLNVDYINEENRQAILDNYGYTYENLSDLFIGYLYDYSNCYDLSYRYYDNADGVELPTEKDIKKRFNIEDAILNQDDKDMCNQYFDRNVTDISLHENKSTIIKKVLPKINETCSQTIIDIILQETGDVDFNNKNFVNPYDELINEKVR